MDTAGQTIFNPATGQRKVFRKTSTETNGELVEMDDFFQPGGFAGPMHLHPYQDERFEVLEGSARFEVAGKQLRLGPGEHTLVPAGVSHTYGNGGEGELHVRAEFRPALGSTEVFYRYFFQLGQEGKLNSKGMPSLLLVAVAMPYVADHVRLSTPPWWVQRTVFAILRPIARLLGYRVPGCLSASLLPGPSQTAQSPGRPNP